MRKPDKKEAVLAPPPAQMVQLLFDQARAAPLQNTQHAAAVLQAIDTVGRFMESFYPQLKKSAAPSTEKKDAQPAG